MQAYFMNISPEERSNILDKHKTVYDGYVTGYAQPKEQPLFVQDFANDKGGVVVNNKGNVKGYTNIGINEEVEEVNKYEFIPTDDNEDEMEFETYDIDEVSDEEIKNNIKEQVEKNLDMFKRFKNFN